jgi:ferredoxin
MQGLPTPTKEAEASIPTKNVRKGTSPNPNLKGAFKIPRKATKRALPWDMKAGELNHSQDQDTHVRKKPRLEEPFSASTGEAATKISSLDTTVSLPPPEAATAAAAYHADSDPMMDMHLNAKATGERRRWTKDEDTRLKKAVLVQTHDGKRQNWDAIAALVPGRTNPQCSSRWYDALDPRNVRTTAFMEKWTPDEDDKLKDAVQMHNGKNWFAITALVPGRTRKQCRVRWRDVFDPREDRTTARTGKWTPDEDDKLKDAVQMHNGKNWFAISTLVLGRTRKQCRARWREAFDPSDDRTSARAGKWTLDEDAKLKDAVQMDGVRKDWKAIARLVPGRTGIQCSNRWRRYLDPNRSTVRG